MRLIDADALKKEFCKDIMGGLNWESIIDNAPTVVNEYTKGFADGERSGRNFPLTDEEKAILVRQWRPQGKWIKIFENPFTNGYVCPFCGHKIQVTEHFLPQVTECEVCGAELKGEEGGSET